MANRLMQLEEEISSSPDEQQDETDGFGESVENYGAAPSAQAESLALARPISYRVPGTVPVVTQPGSMNAWAALTAMMLSWREHQSMSIEDALSRLGQDWVDRFHRNVGLPSEDKASLLAATGLAANPPMKYTPEDWERLLRENGPLWVTDDERAGKLFSPRGYLLLGIGGTGRGRGTRIDAIDPSKGIQLRERLRDFLKRFIHPGAPQAYPRLQVLHLQQSAPNTNGSSGPAPVPRSEPAPTAPTPTQMPQQPAPQPPMAQQPVAQQPATQSYGLAAPQYGTALVAPAVAVAGAGLTYSILKDALAGEGDIKWQLDQMRGVKYPLDDEQTYKNKGHWDAKQVESEAYVENGFHVRVAHAAFGVKFRFDGYSVGDVNLVRVRVTDQPGWGANITANIIPAPEAYLVKGKQPVAAVEVTFEYSFNRSIGQDIIYIDRLMLYGTGDWDQKGEWTQR
jgi:hypothetical protein